jgi:hypothetical protein
MGSRTGRSGRIGRDPAEEVLNPWPPQPAEDAPPELHVAWHDRQADLWDQIAARDAVMAGNAQWMADYHRRQAKEHSERLPQG